AHADYQVYAENAPGEEGLVAFMTLAYTRQEEIAIMPFQTTLGLHYRGLFPGRNNDRTVFFATFGKFSDDYAAERIAAGAGDPVYVLVLGVGQRFEVSKCAYIRPDRRCIIRPGGTGDVDNALVAGVQVGVTF